MVVRDGFSKALRFEQRSDQREGGSLGDFWRKRFSRLGTASAKPLNMLRNPKAVSVPETA